MANNLESDPLVIDTAADQVWVGDPCSVMGFRWVGAESSGDAVTVTDGAGHVKWASVAASEPYNDESFPAEPIYCKGGINVTTIDSGTLYIYLNRL